MFLDDMLSRIRRKTGFILCELCELVNFIYLKFTSSQSPLFVFCTQSSVCILYPICNLAARSLHFVLNDWRSMWYTASIFSPWFVYPSTILNSGHSLRKLAFTTVTIPQISAKCSLFFSFPPPWILREVSAVVTFLDFCSPFPVSRSSFYISSFSNIHWRRHSTWLMQGTSSLALDFATMIYLSVRFRLLMKNVDFSDGQRLKVS